MVDHTPEYAPILQRAIAAYEGLMELYKEDKGSSQYFEHSFAEAGAHRDGLVERLANPVYLADAFKDNFFISIDHFLDSHRGEYQSDMPNPSPAKAVVAGRYLLELREVMREIIRVQNAQTQGI